MIRPAGRRRCWFRGGGPTGTGSSGGAQGSRADASAPPIAMSMVGESDMSFGTDGVEHVPWEEPRRRDLLPVGPPGHGSLAPRFSVTPCRMPVSSDAPCRMPGSSDAPCRMPVSPDAPCRMPVSPDAPCRMPVSPVAPCRMPVSPVAPCRMPVSPVTPSRMLRFSDTPMSLPAQRAHQRMRYVHPRSPRARQLPASCADATVGSNSPAKPWHRPRSKRQGYALSQVIRTSRSPTRS